MTRELAAILESAKRNLLWGSAGTAINTEDIVSQMDPGVAAQIRNNEILIQIARAEGLQYGELESQNERLLASQNLKIRGGCNGQNETEFRNLNDSDPEAAKNKDEDPSNWKWKRGVCAVVVCKSRPGQTEVGPCSVCRSCQAKFDRGLDPTKVVLVFGKQPRETSETWQAPDDREHKKLVQKGNLALAGVQ
jgi:hypothetical protein